jgi:hypothetical protein
MYVDEGHRSCEARDLVGQSELGILSTLIELIYNDG